jgi:hypothetical protein
LFLLIKFCSLVVQGSKASSSSSSSGTKASKTKERPLQSASSSSGAPKRNRVKHTPKIKQGYNVLRKTEWLPATTNDFDVPTKSRFEGYITELNRKKQKRDYAYQRVYWSKHPDGPSTLEREDRLVRAINIEDLQQQFDDARDRCAWVDFVGCSKVSPSATSMRPSSGLDNCCHESFASSTPLSGSDITASPGLIEHTVFEGETLLYHHEITYCVADSVLNLLREPLDSKLVRALYDLSTHTSIKKIATAVRPFYIHLEKLPLEVQQDKLSYLLNPQTQGIYIAREGNHCIGVDCTRRLILDNGNTHAVTLAAENMKESGDGFMSPKTFVELRRVVDRRG